MEEEIWKDIKGYEGLYQVSNLGRVKRILFINNKITKRKERRMAVTDNGKGYKIVGLSKNGKRKNYYVHRLVAQTFISNPNNFKEINHLDCDTSNNKETNLEWCDRSHNVKYSYQLGRHLPPIVVGRKGKLNGISKPVRQYTIDGIFVNEYESAKIASEETGINYTSIKKCRVGKQKTAGGYLWTY